MRAFLCITASVFAALAACAAFGQTAAPPPHFEVADIHPSALTANQVARGPFITGTRYDLRNATMVDLIVRAYDVSADKVLEGPNWLEYDRYDISALVPPKTSMADAKPMLQALLSDRFGLAFRKEERPLSAYALTAPKGSQKLKESDGSGDNRCQLSVGQPRPADPSTAVPPTLTFTCRNMTMAAFAAQLTGMPLAQMGTNPIQDKTGLDGKWDFTFKYTLPTGSGDANLVPDALDKQLGLK
ncbi:MAG: TIGR03435 family protein, partial [Bryobacteraceae bacterium]